MNNPVIVDAVRTPIARAHPKTGMYRDVRADDLSAHLIKALVERTGIEPRLIEDVIWGCVQQQGEQGVNMARTAALVAGLPVESSATTVNRNCGSSLQALNQAAAEIMCGAQDVMIVGGVEHMHHIPMEKDYDPNPELFRRWSPATALMGLTAEFLARAHSIPREEQDKFALRSHQLAAKATNEGAFKSEVVPTWGRNGSGKELFERDQTIREDTTLERLGELRPAFDPKGSVTAGNSSPLSVGASALLMMSEEKASELGLKPMARVKAWAGAGVDPGVMGIGPAPAVKKLLKNAQVPLENVDLIEINEAFSVQTMTVISMLGLDINKVNTRGGAIALGHPLGCSGARISTTLLHSMRDNNEKLGIATMCIGGGQGIATLFERVE